MNHVSETDVQTVADTLENVDKTIFTAKHFDDHLPDMAQVTIGKALRELSERGELEVWNDTDSTSPTRYMRPDAPFARGEQA